MCVVHCADKANYSHTLLSVLGSLTSVLGEDCSPGTVNMEAVIRHPALQAAFQALVASTDEAVLSAAAEAILAAVSLSSSVDSPAKGAQSLATHLLRQVSICLSNQSFATKPLYPYLCGLCG